MTQAKCPLQPEMDSLLTQSQDFFAAIRRLRRRCRSCPAFNLPVVTPRENARSVHLSSASAPALPSAETAGARESGKCPFWEDFNAQIRQATSEVIAELSK